MKYKHEIIIASIASINIVLHLLPGFNFEYHRDELLYFSFVNHLDFGYATTPPLIGIMAFITKSIFGYSVFSIRFFPALFSGLLVYLTAIIAKELNGNFRSQLISAFGVVGTMFLVMIYGIFTPYFLDIFLWTLAIYLLIKFVKTKSGTYLLVLGIAIGLSLLNKYNIIFFIVSALVVLPFTKHRYIFSNRFFYWGFLLSVLIFSPNVIWQIQHHFPVINHMKELNESQLTNINRLEFIFGQLMLLLPFTFVILPGIIFFLVNKQLKDYRFLLSVSAVVIILLLIFRGKSFYASGLYPFLIVVGALFVEKVVVNRYIFSAVV
ncbi:MAG: glycosyltransferase family 39 protein, partial [Bacteroidales bacterium]